MADIVDPQTRSRMMSGIRGKNTQPEMLVRRVLHAMGYRYRLHARELPGKPDIVFRRRRIAIFVHGCFWHRHPDPACRLARMPKSRVDFWQPKLEGNRARDEANVAALEAMGWKVLLVWECQLRDREQLGNMLRRFIEGTQ
ncbi:T/G mismatch-specific endonuclease [Novosphingobium kunmingense]|uniref:Very short patch repair endonuclease n=1 Tax=Novosphingobium kunmingense TaxID=1211806 RepID=A0A2N0H592_9SPHN|nr:very short patch repair endonuclease [Novosphingobium kunmingense]PKB14108.1 T/G mismatch-specific endonuclease [Novosphingobium kunmingense]